MRNKKKRGGDKTAVMKYNMFGPRPGGKEISVWIDEAGNDKFCSGRDNSSCVDNKCCCKSKKKKKAA